MNNQRITCKASKGYQLKPDVAKMTKQQLIDYIGKLEGKVYPELQFEKGQVVYHIEATNHGAGVTIYTVKEDKVRRASQLIDGTPRYRLAKYRFTVDDSNLFASKKEADKRAKELTALSEYRNSIKDAYEAYTLVPQTKFKTPEYKAVYESELKWLKDRYSWKLNLRKCFERDVKYFLEKIAELGDTIIQNEQIDNKYRILEQARYIRRLISDTDSYNAEAKRMNHFIDAFGIDLEKVPEDLKVDEALVAYVAKFAEMIAD